MPINATDVISSCPMFARVKGDSFQRLASIARVCTFDAGQMIFRQGDPVPGVYIVGTGLVRVFKTAPSGKEHVLHLVPPGKTFAEVAAIAGFDCPAFAEALAPTEAVLLPAAPFSKLLREDHPLCLQLLTGLSFWVRHTIEMLEGLALRDAVGRVAKYLLTAADPGTGAVVLPGLKKHLASHLNLTSETLSRTLRKLDESGLIRSSDDTLTVLDREGLTAAVEGEFPRL